jgi:hypothetical protein
MPKSPVIEISDEQLAALQAYQISQLSYEQKILARIAVALEKIAVLLERDRI